MGVERRGGGGADGEGGEGGGEEGDDTEVEVVLPDMGEFIDNGGEEYAADGCGGM